MPEEFENTRSLLRRLSEGDAEAGDRLLPVLYRELHGIARRLMDDQPSAHTLQPTALVHEAWMRLVGGRGQGEWDGRSHFLRVAARAMRSVLTDHARAKNAVKRGGGDRRVSEFLDPWCEAFEERTMDLLALDDALEQLASVDETAVRVVELRFFAGLPVPEVAEVLSVSDTTVERKWRTARAWLRTEIDPSGETRA